MPRDLKNVPPSVQRSMRELSKAFVHHCATLKAWSVKEDGASSLTDVNACAEALLCVYGDFFKNLAQSVDAREEGAAGVRRAAESISGRMFYEAWMAFEKVLAAAFESSDALREAVLEASKGNPS